MDWFVYDIKPLILTVLIFVPLERLLPIDHRQSIFRVEWQLDVVYLLCNSWLIRLGLSLIIFLLASAGGWLIPQYVKLAIGGQSFWLQTIEIILLSDLSFYCVHRLFHMIPFLWRFHAVHHSIEHMDWLAATRIHPIDQILTKGAGLVPIFILGFAPSAIGVSLVLFYWHSMLLHSNMRLSFGPLGWLIASPKFHHWHHSLEPEALDKNFGGQLTMMDLLFGTAYMPKDKWTPSYGVSEPISRNYLNQLLEPFRVLRGRPAAQDFTVAAAADVAGTLLRDRQQALESGRG